MAKNIIHNCRIVCFIFILLSKYLLLIINKTLLLILSCTFHNYNFYNLMLKFTACYLSNFPNVWEMFCSHWHHPNILILSPKYYKTWQCSIKIWHKMAWNQHETDTSRWFGWWSAPRHFKNWVILTSCRCMCFDSILHF